MWLSLLELSVPRSVGCRGPFYRTGKGGPDAGLPEPVGGDVGVSGDGPDAPRRRGRAETPGRAVVAVHAKVRGPVRRPGFDHQPVRADDLAQVVPLQVDEDAERRHEVADVLAGGGVEPP